MVTGRFNAYPLNRLNLSEEKSLQHETQLAQASSKQQKRVYLTRREDPKCSATLNWGSSLSHRLEDRLAC